MAKKISELTAITGADLSGTDIIPVVDVSASASTANKKVTIDELKNAGSIFTALSGLTWDGSYKKATLAGDTALTFSSTKRSGMLIVKQDGTGGRTLSINGTNVAINAGANETSIIIFIYDDLAADYIFTLETDIVGISGGVGDTTAPVIVSATIEDADPTMIILTYDEALDTGSVPATGDFVLSGGNLVTAVNVTGSTVELTTNGTYVFGDTDGVTYNGTTSLSPIKDVAGNEAADLSNYSVTNNLSGSGEHAYTTAWATAAGIAAGSYRSAVNTFVNALDTAGILSTHFDFIQILCGGTETASKFNLVNPADTDAAYRATFPNGATFASTGVTTNGTNQYINTHWIGATASKAQQDDYHIGVFNRTSAGVAGFTWGVSDGSSIIYGLTRSTDDNSYIKQVSTGENSFADATTGKGHYLAQTRPATAPVCGTYKDGAVKISAANNGNGLDLPATYKLFFNAYNNSLTISQYRAGELSIIHAGKSFTEAERTAFNTAIQNLVTALGL